MPNTYRSRTFEEQAQYELLIMSQDTYPIPTNLHLKAQDIITRDAEESKHMRVSDFVDLCIDIARLK